MARAAAACAACWKQRGRQGSAQGEARRAAEAQRGCRALFLPNHPAHSPLPRGHHECCPGGGMPTLSTGLARPAARAWKDCGGRPSTAFCLGCLGTPASKAPAGTTDAVSVSTRATDAVSVSARAGQPVACTHVWTVAPIRSSTIPRAGLRGVCSAGRGSSAASEGGGCLSGSSGSAEGRGEGINTATRARRPSSGSRR